MTLILEPVFLSLKINGEATQIEAGTVSEMLTALGISTSKVAVERNREIVPKSLYAKVSLAEGDEIEIVQFVGGG